SYYFSQFIKIHGISRPDTYEGMTPMHSMKKAFLLSCFLGLALIGNVALSPIARGQDPSQANVNQNVSPVPAPVAAAQTPQPPQPSTQFTGPNGQTFDVVPIPIPDDAGGSACTRKIFKGNAQYKNYAFVLPVFYVSRNRAGNNVFVLDH